MGGEGRTRERRGRGERGLSVQAQKVRRPRERRTCGSAAAGTRRYLRMSCVGQGRAWRSGTHVPGEQPRTSSVNSTHAPSATLHSPHHQHTSSVKVPTSLPGQTRRM